MIGESSAVGAIVVTMVAVGLLVLLAVLAGAR